MSGPTQGTQSIDRAGEMLARLLESDEPMSLRDLAEAADLPKSTASRLITALERHGLVHQAGERGKLEPGPAILRFAHRGGLERHLVELAEPALEAVAQASGETVNLSVPTPTASTTSPRSTAATSSAPASGSGAAWTTTAPPTARSSSPSARLRSPPGRWRG